MFSFFRSDNSNSDSHNNFTSYFVMVVMCLFMALSLFRKTYNDPVIFYIDKAGYTFSYCKKYTSLLNSNEKLKSHDKFMRHYSEVIQIASRSAVISDLCDKVGIVVSHDDVRKNIFQDYRFMENGEFSREKFLAYLEEKDISENDFYELCSEELRHKQFWFLLQNSYHLREKFIKLFDEAFFAKRYVRFAKVNHSNVDFKYTDKDLLRFYNENKQSFYSLQDYKYRALTIKRIGLSQEDFNLLNKMIQNGNFDGIFKNYSCNLLDHDDVVRILGDQKFYYDNQNWNVNDCFSSSMGNDDILIIQVQSKKEGVLIPFNEIKNYVISLYKQKYLPDSIKINSLVWDSSSCSADDFFSLDLPYKISKSIFSLSLGHMQSYHLDGVSYFVIVDKIVSSNSIDKHSLLLDYLNYEMKDAIFTYLLNRVRLAKGV